MNKNQKMKIALIGAGSMGKRWAKAVALNNIGRLVAVADIDIKKAKTIAAQFRYCHAVDDWGKAIKSIDVDAIIVATPHKFLAPISISALKADKHVLCEKPGGLSSKEISKVLATARQTKKCYMVSFNHRFHDAFLKARKLLNRGLIGEIIFIRSRYGFGGRADYQEEWRMNKKISGGGELIDQGVHMIDLAHSFLGKFEDVCGFAENTFWKSKIKVDDNAFVLLKNRRNQIASIHVSWTNWKPIHNFEIFGTKGYLVIEGLGRKYGDSEKLLVGIRSADFVSLPKEKTLICNSDADISLVGVLKEFTAAIREKREPSPSGNDAYQVLKIVEKIYNQK